MKPLHWNDYFAGGIIFLPCPRKTECHSRSIACRVSCPSPFQSIRSKWARRRTRSSFSEGSFDAAIKGCEAVLHTASPFYMAGGSKEKLVEPAMKGTANVLGACAARLSCI